MEVCTNADYVGSTINKKKGPPHGIACSWMVIWSHEEAKKQNIVARLSAGAKF